MRIVTLTTKEPFLPLSYLVTGDGDPYQATSRPGSARWEKHKKAIADCRDAMATEFEVYGEDITVLNYTEKEREDVGKDCAVFVIEAVILVRGDVVQEGIEPQIIDRATGRDVNFPSGDSENSPRPQQMYAAHGTR